MLLADSESENWCQQILRMKFEVKPCHTISAAVLRWTVGLEVFGFFLLVAGTVFNIVGPEDQSLVNPRVFDGLIIFTS